MQPKGAHETEAVPGARPGGLSFSVVVSALNAADVLQNCIDSFVRQTFPSKELLIIDGGSSDGSRAILEANAHNLAYWVSEGDRGICDAWNKAIKRASGKWIVFLGADDYFWSPTVLSDVSLKLEQVDRTYTIAYGCVMTVTGSGDLERAWGAPWEIVAAGFRSGMTIPHQGVFHRATLFDEIGGFDPDFRYAGDYEFLVRAFRDGTPMFLGDAIITGMTVGGLSSRPSLSWRILNEFRRARRKNDMPQFTWAWSWAFFKAIVKGLAAAAAGDAVVAGLLKRLADQRRARSKREYDSRN